MVDYVKVKRLEDIRQAAETFVKTKPNSLLGKDILWLTQELHDVWVKKEEEKQDSALLRKKLIAIQLEHSTTYIQKEKGWAWSCTCGAWGGKSINDLLADHDECHRRTREHWADVVLKAL